MSRVCPCCGQIVGSFPVRNAPPWSEYLKDLEQSIEIEQAVLDAIRAHPHHIHLTVPAVIRDIDMSENNDDSEDLESS